MMKEYRSLIKENPQLSEYSYQKEFLTNGKFLSSKKPFVLAMGTSAGKTITTIMFLEMYYRKSSNKHKKTFIIPSSITILRDNFENTIKKFDPSFKYKVAKNSKELIKILNENDYDVLICLPLTLIKQIKSLPKIDNFILDEAHQWYFEKTITDLLYKLRPNHQLLLSGTPSKFIQYENKFNFQFVPIMKLYEEGLVSNAKVEIVSADYNVKNSDYISDYGNLKKSKSFTKNQNRSSLEYLCNLMLTKVKNKPKNIFDIFNYLPKTIIFCHSIQQSKDFYNILNKNINTKKRVLISNLIDDIDSKKFKMFNNDKKQKVLICVNRGRIGLSMNQLFNVVDFTMTKNIDVMLQIYGRLLRKSKYDEVDKTYFKICPINDVYYFENIMNAMLCLTQKEWFTKYNGLNMNGLRIPLIRNNYINQHKTNNTSSKQTEKREFDREKFGIPIDLNYFKKIKEVNKKLKIKSVSYTNLDEVFNISKKFQRVTHSYESISKSALKFNSKIEFLENDFKAYRAAVRLGILNEVCSHMTKVRRNHTEKSLREIAKKYKNIKDFYTNDLSAYKASKKMNCFESITKHMINRLGLSNSTIIKISKNYKSLAELKKDDKVAYKMICDRDLFRYLKFK